VADIAPKGRYVVGKAASGAGMTATVVKDEYLKGWALEAGAMVLANKGIVCIDEIEKMDPIDRSAMHESLEQQTVTISKANIQASLQAQTSVLAAGNPKLGRFEPYQTIAQQIDLPPTLINRFDVIFVLRDIPDKFKDESVATHVLSIYQKKEKQISVERDLFRKYVAYAKQKIKPILTDEAVKEIKDFYVRMRNMPVSADSTGSRAIPISARQLEALVRLSEAHAKMRLSKKVTKEDARIAIELITYYMMQVGYDYETKTFDIDRISTGVSSSQRSKVIILRETLSKLEEKLGKFIPMEELEKELTGKMNKDDIDDAVQKLIASGDIFIPRKGFVQRI
jgi:replicative DNA helicase Mcm